MFSYYGAKTRIIDLYPPPKYGKIIEPFAGSARYALKYFDREVLLVDKYEVVIGIWKYLQQATEKEILSMPRQAVEGVLFDTIDFACEEQKLLFRFLCGSGDAVPRNKPTARKTTDRPNTINKRVKEIAANLFKIRHWKIELGSYEDIPNEEATWFIDPPYQVGGSVYKENRVDYRRLGPWSQSRGGQIIVCENTKADWLPFIPMVVNHGSNRKTTEAIWLNFESSLNVTQQTLFL